jgi:hypothetical protein
MYITCYQNKGSQRHPTLQPLFYEALYDPGCLSSAFPFVMLLVVVSAPAPAEDELHYVDIYGLAVVLVVVLLGEEK